MRACNICGVCHFPDSIPAGPKCPLELSFSTPVHDGAPWPLHPSGPPEGAQAPPTPRCICACAPSAARPPFPFWPPEGARALPTGCCVCACAAPAPGSSSPPLGSRHARPRPFTPRHAPPRARTLHLGCPRLLFVDFRERGSLRCAECRYGGPRGFRGPLGG